MKYIQFFNFNTHGELDEACGSFAVVTLDGRCTMERHHSVAIRVGTQRKYPAYRIMEGEKYSTAKPRANGMLFPVTETHANAVEIWNKNNGVYNVRRGRK